MHFSPSRTVAPITLQEMIDHLDSIERLDTDEKVADCVEPLRALGAGVRPVLRDLALGILARPREHLGQERVSNSFLLHTARGVTIRLNAWRPLRPGTKFDRYNGRPYAYGFPHDHDFDLLTVGALGPGYTTTIAEYDRPEGEMFVGCRPAFRQLGEFTLNEGAILFYEQSKDVHIQHPSPDFSISINVLASQRVSRRTGQFVFDPGCCEVLGIPEYLGSRVLRIVDLLLESGDVDWDLLFELVRHYGDEFVARGLLRMIPHSLRIDREEVAERLGLQRYLEDLREAPPPDLSRIIIDA